MRLDARKGDSPYDVWLADECRVPKYCVWVDDVTNQWAAWKSLVYFINCEPEVHQARAIKIYLDRRLIIINPIADALDDEIIDAVAAKNIAERVLAWERDG